MRPLITHIKGDPYGSRIRYPLVKPRVCPLTSQSLVVRGSRGWDLDPQHIVFFSKPPCFLEQGLHFPFAFHLSSFHGYTPIKIAFISHGWRTASGRCGHPCQCYFPHTAPMLRAEATRSTVVVWGTHLLNWIWYFLPLTCKRCPDKGSGHTL